MLLLPREGRIDKTGSTLETERQRVASHSAHVARLEAENRRLRDDLDVLNQTIENGAEEQVESGTPQYVVLMARPLLLPTFMCLDAYFIFGALGPRRLVSQVHFQPGGSIASSYTSSLTPQPTSNPIFLLVFSTCGNRFLEDLLLSRKLQLPNPLSNTAENFTPAGATALVNLLRTREPAYRRPIHQPQLPDHHPFAFTRTCAKDFWLLRRFQPSNTSFESPTAPSRLRDLLRICRRGSYVR